MRSSISTCSCSYRCCSISLVNPTIVQNEGDGDVSVCARLESPEGGTEKEIVIDLNNGEFIDLVSR